MKENECGTVPEYTALFHFRLYRIFKIGYDHMDIFIPTGVVPVVSTHSF